MTSQSTPQRDVSGTRCWYANGKLHRIDGPAVEYSDGSTEWYSNGELHRIDGPAMEAADGYKAWWVKGKVHRTDGPAIEHPKGYKEWRVNGEMHRADGPAMEWADGRKAWWVNGEPISTPYNCVLSAAFALGLHIPEEVLPEMLKSMHQTQGSQDDQLNQLNNILHKYWPLHVKRILVRLFSSTAPALKHIAFSLLGREVVPERAKGSGRL